MFAYLSFIGKLAIGKMEITDHTKRAGTIICEGPDYNTAKQRVEVAVNKIIFITE